MASLKSKLSLIYSAKSDIGLIRTENQDSFGKFPEENLDLYSAKGQLFIVADGMGGHKGGKEASSIAVNVISSEYFNLQIEDSEALKESIEKANSAIFTQAGVSSEFGGMGTTCSVLLLKDEKGVIGHVGDSRIYKIENNKLEQLTNDHTKVEEMLREGILTPEEAKNYPSKSVLARALGVEAKVRVDIITNINLNNEPIFVMCSDGLAKVSEKEILSIVSSNNTTEACNKLVDLANERGGKDNVTVLIIKIYLEQSAKLQEGLPQKNKVKHTGGKSKIWLGLLLIFILILIVVYQYKASIKSVFIHFDKGTSLGKDTIAGNKINATLNSDLSNSELLNDADKMVKQGNYDKALSIYKTILINEPMHQAALNGVNEIATRYSSLAEKYLKEKKFTEALNYFKKAAEIQPGNEKIKGLIRLCARQMEYYDIGMDSSVENNHLSETAGSQITVTRFDLPRWGYPGTNKNEFSITSSELSFTNTLTEKFIIYDSDINDISIAINFITENSNSTFGLIIGYVSPTEYYIFKHTPDGDYILQKINGSDTEKLLVVSSRGSDNISQKLMKVKYSDNTISIYNENGLLSSYRSYTRVFGKAGLYVDKNVSVKFQNLFLNGNSN